MKHMLWNLKILIQKSKNVYNGISFNLDFIFRENDLLKHQLKKYVSAVQMLRQNSSNTGKGAERKVEKE